MEKKRKERKKKPVSKMTKDMWITLLSYSATHWVADMAAGAVVMASLIRYGYNAWDSFVLIVLYNFFSFGLQLMFGIFIDKYRVPREATILSFILIGAAFFVTYDPVLVVILAGIGDSLFHVGGGSVSLSFMPRKLLPAALFVAPGALGLFSGIIIGRGTTIPFFDYFSVHLSFASLGMKIFLLIALAISTIAVTLLEAPEGDYEKVNTRKKINHWDLISWTLWFSVAIRSLHGLTAGFEWQKGFWLPFLLVFGIASGKALGGVIGDKVSWTKVAVFSLLISAPLMAFAKDYVFLAILGMGLFQMTMPITLVCRSNLFQGRPATAFGFACLALMAGALPIYLGAETLKPILREDTNIFIVILVSVACIFVGLSLLKPYFKKELKMNL